MKKSQASPIGCYLVDADELRAAYRDRFLRGLSRLRKRGELKLRGDFADLQHDDAWTAFLESLRSTDWVSYLEPPPTVGCRLPPGTRGQVPGSLLNGRPDLGRAHREGE